MIEQPFLAPVPVPSSHPARKVAVVLNGNARAVSRRLISEVRQVLRDETLFVSHTIEQWRFMARRIVNEGFDTVICGGGDGTFTRCVSDILALGPQTPPCFGILRLGTGNALATTLGSSPATAEGLRQDLSRASLEESRGELPMLQVEGKLAPFSGIGMDSLILEDYNHVKDSLAGTPLASLGKGAAGYALAISTRSLWRYVSTPEPTVLVRNEGEPAQRVDVRGNPVGKPVPRGAVIFEGPVSIAAAATIPYYGLGLRLFPQAQARADRFQLRVARVNPFRVLANLQALFRGEYEHPGIHDYLCSAVSMHLQEPCALQIGGDEVGRRTVVRMSLGSINAVWSQPPRRASAQVLSLEGRISGR